MIDPRLAGLDKRDIVTERHPWLHPLAVKLLAALPVGSGPGSPGWDAARRERTASFTPSGEPEPPEVAGVDAAARVPNADQPMAGEIEAGHEVGQGNPAFFGLLMPPPTGTTNNVGVPQGPVGAYPFAPPRPPIAADRFAAPPGRSSSRVTARTARR